MREIKCIVSAENASGSPDLYFVKIRTTREQIDYGDHLIEAKLQASINGYSPHLSYDEDDSAGRAMLLLFAWDSASVIDITQKDEYRRN